MGTRSATVFIDNEWDKATEICVMKRTQCQQVLDHLKAGHSITTFDAFTRFGITRLPDRVSRKLREVIRRRTEHAG